MRLDVPVLLVLAACGDNVTPELVGLTIVSGDTPFRHGCNGVPQSGTVFPSAEVEPWLATDPANPAHLVASWQQDRWTTGGANANGTAASFDGGDTWTRSFPKFSACAGGARERTSDPWVAITPDGSVWAAGLAFDDSAPHSTVAVARSQDGGVTWDDPITLIGDDSPDVFDDKDSITADPTIPGRVYAVWDRLTGLTQPTQPIGTGPTYLARLIDGSWEAAHPIFDPGVDNQTIGNVIVVLPDGTLVDVFDLITGTSAQNPATVAAAVRSTDHGATWSAPVTIAALDGIGVGDAKGVPIRSGAGLVQTAVDPHTGAIYVAWENMVGNHDGIAVARSRDAGATWSAPVEANGAPDVPAFEPTVAVAGNGAVGLFYYDLRGATSSAFRATPWLATSVDGGATWTEDALADPFDLAPALVGGAYFLGDYQGLASAGDGIYPLFGIARSAADPTDIFIRPQPR